MAGIVLAVFGPAFCFGINAVSYLGVIVGLVMMRVTPTVRAPQPARPSPGSGRAWAYVRATPPIYRTIVLVGAVGIFGMNFNVWVPLLASDSFDSGASAYGLLFSAMGIGSLAGALSLAMFGRSPNRTQMLGRHSRPRGRGDPARGRRCRTNLDRDRHALPRHHRVRLQHRHGNRQHPCPIYCRRCAAGPRDGRVHDDFRRHRSLRSAPVRRRSRTASGSPTALAVGGQVTALAVSRSAGHSGSALRALP